jgi:hypothetical protein
MNTPIKLPNIAKDGPTGITEYHFTLPDKTVAIKTLKELITELGQPNIALFTDGTFTVGRQPIVYQKQDGNWLNLFRFEACQIYDNTNQVKPGELSFTMNGKLYSTAPFANDDKGGSDVK